MKLVSVSEMKNFEKEADSLGHTYDQMMDLAGSGVGDIVLSMFGYEETKSALGLVGPGNNGGDTLVALTLLAQAGWITCAYLVRDRSEADQRLKDYLDNGGEVVEFSSDTKYKGLDEWLGNSTVLLDGVFGTGVKSPIQKKISDLLSHVAHSPLLPYVVAVDCPSGVNCDTGEVYADCIPAEITVCMAAVKMGLVKFPAFNFIGDLETVDIGLPEGVEGWNKINLDVVDMEMVHALLPERRSDANKGTFGTAFIVAGSVNYTGAAYLAAKAAYRIGAGLVQTAVPGVLHAALAGQLPESTWVLLPHELGVISEAAADVVLRNLEKATAMLIGPGIGLEDTTGDFLQRVLVGKGGRQPRGGIGFVGSSSHHDAEVQTLPAIVVDADGLKLLSRLQDWHQLLKNTAILTPHPGEMSFLTGLTVAEIQANRVEIAQKYAQKWGHVVVLKGALTVVAEPSGKACVIPVATAALARAGTGDVLAGLITGLRAQGVDPYQAALAGAYIHAQAGLLAADQIGHEAAVLAGDVLDAVPQVLSTVW